MPLQTARTPSPRWIAVDWAVASYAAAVALLVLISTDTIPQWPLLVGLHVALLLTLLALPPRGAAWETWAPAEPRWRVGIKRVARFLRYTYPAVLLTPFFEEVRFTVNAIAPADPYWFERHLYAADLALFGALPAQLLSQWHSLLLDEMMHALYFSYYPLIISGIVIAWVGPSQPRLVKAPTPGPGFDRAMTSMLLGFFLAYVWYPWLPARGPWENRELTGTLPAFQGVLFTPLVQWIIDRAAVSGGCFPSAHVSGAWGLVLGLVPVHRRVALGLGLIAAGMSLSCVYTRYHHSVDIPAGFAAGLLGAGLGWRLTRHRSAPSLASPHIR